MCPCTSSCIRIGRTFAGPSVVPGNFFRGGGSTNSVEDREKGDLGAVSPYSGVLEAAVIWYKKFHFI
jgi:hypothetical protein